MNHSTPGLPVHHQLPEFTETHVHWVGDAIQPSHPLSSPSPPAPNPSQHQSLFQWVNSSHEVAKELQFQLHINNTSNTMLGSALPRKSQRGSGEEPKPGGTLPVSLHFVLSTTLPFLTCDMNHCILIYLRVKKAEKYICQCPFLFLFHRLASWAINTPSSKPNTHRLHTSITNAPHDISSLRSNRKASGRKDECAMWV